MTQKHTPGPWGIDRDLDSHCDYVLPSPAAWAINPHAIATVAMQRIDNEWVSANAPHIVACVNACAGINPEAVPEMLAALEAVIHAAFEPTWAQLVADAIAKAKGV